MKAKDITGQVHDNQLFTYPIMKNILFIVPPYISYDSFINPLFNERIKNGRGSIVTDMPIGLISISAYLKKHENVNIQLIDFNTILNKITSFTDNSFLPLYQKTFSTLKFIPDIIAISSLFNTTYYNTIDISNITKKIFPNSIITAGGAIPTNMYKEIFRDTNSFDALCFGEGEKPMLSLIRNINSLKTHPSWITKEKIDKNEQFKYDFIENLDEIPHYDYSILDIKDYLLNPTVSNYSSFKETNLFHIATSRGCTNKCTFCASHSVHGRKMRYHSITRVEEDIKKLINTYSINAIGIQDDNFMSDKIRANKIINICKKLNVSIFFQSGLALHALDRKTLENIKKAGLNELVLAIESGSDKVLKQIMKKPLNTKIIRQVVNDCRDLNISTDANILIGMPGETKEDIENTIKFLKTIDCNWYRIYIVTPLVGSEVNKICIANNYIDQNDLSGDFKRPIINTEHFTSTYIQETAYRINLELNFVNNADMRLHNWEKALEGFENAIRVKNDHAFAYYFAAICYKQLNNIATFNKYSQKYQNIIQKSSFWKNYYYQFKLEPL